MDRRREQDNHRYQRRRRRRRKYRIDHQRFSLSLSLNRNLSHLSLSHREQRLHPHLYPHLPLHLTARPQWRTRNYHNNPILSPHKHKHKHKLSTRPRCSHKRTPPHRLRLTVIPPL